MIPNSKRFCIVVYVFGAYTRYIPYFIYSIHKNYPAYHVKIFLEEKLPDSVKIVNDKLKKAGAKFDIIKPEDFAESTKVKHSLNVDIRLFYRFLIAYKDLAHFDYVYVGDVDMFILKEKPSLLEFHLSDLEINDIPVSNCVRLDEDGNFTNRLTGLHFFKVKEYYSALGDLIDELRESPDKLSAFVKGFEWEEQALYKLVNKGFDIKCLEKEHYPRPWHGLHLGAARKIKIRTKSMFEENSTLSMVQCKSAMEEHLKDDILLEIMDSVYDRSFCSFLDFLNVKPKSYKAKKVLYRYRVVELSRKIKKKLNI